MKDLSYMLLFIAVGVYFLVGVAIGTLIAKAMGAL